MILKKSGQLLIRHELEEGTTTLGRSDKCDFTIPSEDVAELHATVTGRGGRFQMRHRSGDPIRCKGVNFTQRMLEPGDEVRICDYTVVFADEVSEPPLPVKGKTKSKPPPQRQRAATPAPDKDVSFMQEFIQVVENDLEQRGLSIGLVAKGVLFIVIVFSLGRVWGAIF